jgi:hypothetical protein
VNEEVLAHWGGCRAKTNKLATFKEGVGNVALPLADVRHI